MSSNQFEQALSKGLVDTIVELQSLPCLSAFALAGGTSLALRFNHRRSIDIDLFSNHAVGMAGLMTIQSDLEKYYRHNLINCEIIDPEAGDQYCFLRAFVSQGGENIIKVEVIQNVQTLDIIEYINDIKILSLRDIGLLKLMSASSRKARKDIYDLDFITDLITLSDLLIMLKEKEIRFKEDNFKCLFDLDNERSPSGDLNLLLAFDQIDYNTLPRRPNHSNDIIDILSSSKNWRTARSNWRRKVINLMRQQGMTPPPVRPIN
jgi:hypothetical protein